MACRLAVEAPVTISMLISFFFSVAQWPYLDLKRCDEVGACQEREISGMCLGECSNGSYDYELIQVIPRAAGPALSRLVLCWAYIFRHGRAVLCWHDKSIIKLKHGAPACLYAVPAQAWLSGYLQLDLYSSMQKYYYCN